MRKQFAQKFSVSANHYVDKVSSASIDVVTTASPYEEERTQHSVGLDYLHDRWMMNIGFTNSEENDYAAETFSFGMSQDIFGDLTTVSLGYSLGNDTVEPTRRRGFGDTVERQQYRLGVSQILTKNLLLGLSFETITDEGFLNNPYRQVRYRDTTTPQGYSYEREIYPRTRSSDAGAIRLRYYLPYRAAVHAEYRQYADTWDIEADTFELGYTHPIESGWTFEGKVRSYSQTKADFYSDLFSRSQFQNFMARDKELSTFTSQTIRLGGELRHRARRMEIRRARHGQRDCRPHDVRLRRLPRSARDRHRAGQRAALHLRRQRHPSLRLVLVLISPSVVAPLTAAEAAPS